MAVSSFKEAANYYADDRRASNSNKKRVQVSCTQNLHQIFDAIFVQEHQIERVLFRARNLHKKNLAASRYYRHALRNLYVSHRH